MGTILTVDILWGPTLGSISRLQSRYKATYLIRGSKPYLSYLIPWLTRGLIIFFVIVFWKKNVKLDLTIIIKSRLLKISKAKFLQAAPQNTFKLGLASVRPHFLLRSIKESSHILRRPKLLTKSPSLFLFRQIFVAFSGIF